MVRRGGLVIQGGWASQCAWCRENEYQSEAEAETICSVPSGRVEQQRRPWYL